LRNLALTTDLHPLLCSPCFFFSSPAAVRLCPSPKPLPGPIFARFDISRHLWLTQDHHPRLHWSNPFDAYPGPRWNKDPRNWGSVPVTLANRDHRRSFISCHNLSFPAAGLPLYPHMNSLMIILWSRYDWFGTGFLPASCSSQHNLIFHVTVVIDYEPAQVWSVGNFQHSHLLAHLTSTSTPAPSNTFTQQLIHIYATTPLIFRHRKILDPTTLPKWGTS